MHRSSLLLQLVWAATAIGIPSAAVARSAALNVPVDQSARAGGAGTVAYGQTFLQISSLSKDDPVFGLLSPPRSDGRPRTLMLGRARYAAPVSPENLGPAFFQNAQRTRYLVGPAYALAFSSHSPNSPLSFAATRESPLPLFPAVSSRVVLRAAPPQNMTDMSARRVAQVLDGNPSKTVCVVWQRISGFSAQAEAAFVLTFVRRAQAGSEIEVFVGTVLFDDEAMSFEGVLNTVAAGAAAKDLIGYAQRLGQFASAPR